MDLKVNSLNGLVVALLLILVCPTTTLIKAYEAPDDCEWILLDDTMARDNPELDIDLTCHLSAINSNIEKTNFSVIPSHRTRSLTIKCSDSSLSTLEPGAFASLSTLEELKLESCRLEHIPQNAFQGLEGLKSLVIHTEHSSFLAIEEGSFRGVPELRALDLSGNYIRSLPSQELCHLPKLQWLNMSFNEIESFGDIGLEWSQEKMCLSQLSVLDLSHNEISRLDDLPSTVRELLLNANFIRHIAEDLDGKSLQILDLSQNQLSMLPKSVFSRLPSLLVLNLANNSLANLDETMLDGLVALEVLNLSGNAISSGQITASLFQDVKQTLLELVLSSNQLEEIGIEQEDLFSSQLARLEVLKLDNNQLSSLPNGFAPLHVQELDLSHNKLTTLKSLGRLPQMTHLHLSHNNLNSIEEKAFMNCSNILVLDLSHNDLAQVPSSLTHLKSLQTLDLSFNAIVVLEGSAMLQMESLWRLQLSGNRLGNISVGLFDDLKALQVLDLANNQISQVEKGSFDANRQLQAIRLDGNRLQSMDGLFGNLEQLIWLNISDNSIRHFDYALIPLNLHWLDISHNQLEELGNYFDLTGEIALGVLDAGFNRLTQLGPNSIPNSIETLLVNDNQLEQIVPYTFFKKTRLAKVDLTVNNLKGIDRNALRLSSEVVRVPEFFLGGNPIECDCEMVWFKSINVANSMQNYPSVQDIESIYCRLIYTREVSFVPLVEARNEQFLCPYQTHCFALCKCCDFDACDCEMSCPDNCTCYHDNSWSKNIAVCSNSEFNDLPEQLPMDATEIFLDGNSLSELGSHTFIGRKNLRILHLNNSQIHSIQNKTFNGLSSLTVLHLESNQLKELSGYEFETLDSLRELYLENNLLEHIHNATFKFLGSLEVLHIQGNRIIDFPVWELAFNPFLVSIKLAENIWSCDCDYMERFRSWMTVYSSKIFDADNVSCITNEASDMNVRMSDFDVSTCSSMKAIATTRIQEMSSEDYLPLLAATLASFALFLLVLLALFTYRHTLRVWIHSKYGVRVFDNSFNEDDSVEGGKKNAINDQMTTGTATKTTPKLFDVFVSYSPKDDLFVRDVLATELEHGSASQYKTCLFHRDIANQTYIADTLIQATEASRRTIMVLSEHFLKTEWSRYDYKSGLHQALRTGRRKLIVILLGDISSRDVDPDLRLYLKTSIVLQWGDRLFWEKLRYALPDDSLEVRFHTEQGKMATNRKSQQGSSSSASSRVSTISPAASMMEVEDHYYHQPRYATYLPPPPPISTLANNLIMNNNHHHHLQQQQYPSHQYPVGHVGTERLSPQSLNHGVASSTSPCLSSISMVGNLPGQQTPSRSSVVMHI